MPAIKPSLPRFVVRSAKHSFILTDMSEEKENENEGIVIDVVAEVEEPKAEQEAVTQPEEKINTEPPPPQPVKQRSTLPSLILAILAILLAAGTAIVGMQLWSGVTQEIHALDARFDATLKAQDNLQTAIGMANAAIATQQQLMDKQRSDVAEQQQNLSQQIQGISSERRQMNLRETELKSLVADIHKRIGRSDSQWRVAEAEYLIRVAITRLQLAKDIDTAMQALNLADDRLRDTAEPQWDPIRQRLAKDIAALAAVELPDTAGISAQLTALSEQVPALTLVSTHEQMSMETSNASSTDRESRSWSTLADDMLSGIKDSVRIRRNDEPVHALLTPDQQHFMYQNLALQLETARMALVQQDKDAYQASLARAKQWITELFDARQAATQSMLTAINELIATDIAPPLPDITQSLMLLLERQAVNKTLAETNP